MKILVTGAAGFIGFHTCLKLVSQGHEVYGIDNINDYYDPKLKFDRLNELGFDQDETKLFKNEVKSAKFNSLRFSRIDITDEESIDTDFIDAHCDNWKDEENPTEEELTKSFKNECESWLNDLGIGIEFLEQKQDNSLSIALDIMTDRQVEEFIARTEQGEL